MKHVVIEDAFEKVGRVLSEKYGIKVIFEGNACCTNGRVIRLPALPPDVPPEVMGLLRCYLDHEVGHILGESDLDMFKAFAKKYGPQALGLLNTLEDLRVDQVMRRAYAGSGINLRAGLEEVTKRLASLPLDPMKQIMTAVYTRGSRFPDLPFIAPEIYAMCDSVSREIRAAVTAQNTREVVRLTLAIWKWLKSHKPQSETEEQRQEASPGQGSGQGQGDQGQEPQDGQEPQGAGSGGQEQPREGAGQEQEQEQEQEQDQEDQDQDPASPDATSCEQAQPGGQSPEPASQGATSRDPAQDSPMAGLGDMISQGLINHTDTNMTYRPWTTEYDTVTVAPDTPGHDHAAMLREVMPLVGGVRQRLLQCLLAETYSRWYGEQERGRIDPKSLHRLALGTGDRVFRRRVKSQGQSTVVALALDLSASMNPHKMELARQACLVFAEALDKLAIPCAILGFTTHSNNLCEQISMDTGIPVSELAEKFRTYPLAITVFKRPEEPWRQVSGRLERMQRIYYTPLGEGVLAAARMLSGRREERKVILAVTDGSPDVGLSGNEDRAFRHAKDSIALCEKSGFEVVLVGIGEDSVRRLTDKSVVVTAIDELPRTVIRELEGILVKGGKQHVRAVAS